MSQFDLAANLCREVTDKMIKCDQPSCVLGSRLLLGVLQPLGIEAAAIGVSVTVLNPLGGKLYIGDPDFRAEKQDHQDPFVFLDQPGGFPGHVVVLARAEGGLVLLDPTIFQVIPIFRGSCCSAPVLSMVLPVADPQALTLGADASAVRDGWIYEYSPAPHLDWLTRSEWVDLSYSQGVEEELRLQVRRFRPSRNEPCPCRSGSKYKQCHGR